MFGASAEEHFHRPYCDCVKCAKWRKYHEEAAKKLNAGDRKE